MKPRTLLTTAALFAAALFILDVPAAYAVEDYTWTGKDKTNPTYWNDEDNWSAPGDPGGYPDDNGDTATIADVANDPDVNEDVTIGGLTVDAGGVLDILDGYTLTLDGSVSTAHTINGTINLLYDDPDYGTLAFTVNDQGLTGSGSIVGANSACRITLGANDLELTSSIAISGALAITDLDSYTTTSFVNNGAVRAYIGTLEIRVDDLDDDPSDVSPSAVTGTWTVDTSSSAKLWFRTGGSTALTGNVTVDDGGTLDCDVTLTTTGNLSLSGTNSKIEVAAGQTLTAS